MIALVSPTLLHDLSAQLEIASLASYKSVFLARWLLMTVVGEVYQLADGIATLLSQSQSQER